MKEKVVIFGTNTLSANAFAFYTHEDTYEVIGFTVDEQYIAETTFLGLPVLPYEKLRELLHGVDFNIFVTVGYSDLNRNRAKIIDRVRQDGYRLCSCISKTLINTGSKIGDNAFIFPGVILDPFVEVGEGVLISSNVYIAHYCTIGDYCYIGGGTVIAGSTAIGRNTTIGCNSTIGHTIKIGEYCFLGDGTVVCKDTEDYSVYLPVQSPKAPLNSERIKKMIMAPIGKKK